MLADAHLALVMTNVCLVVFSDKYQLIGTLVNDCSCHSNVNCAAAAAAGGGADTPGTPHTPHTPGTPGSEGINAAAAAPSSSGICVLV